MGRCMSLPARCSCRWGAPGGITVRPPSDEAPSSRSSQGEGVGISVVVGEVLRKRMKDLRVEYEMGKVLGKGQFGVTYLCREKGTGDEYACKSISKGKLTCEEDVEDLRREVEIMHHLAGQPGIVELRAAYEDVAAVHLVMELCAGGELFDRISRKGRYSERAAADLFRTIVQAVHTCHSLGVMHRDLKPENFLFLTRDEDSLLKATDFGLSVFFKPGMVFHDIVGSAYYVAPEVLNQNYSHEADIWSAGIILYILLCGIPPFWGETENAIFEAIKEQDLLLPDDNWSSISAPAKDLVKKMLNKNPKERLTAHAVINHSWVREDGDAPDKPLDNAVLSRMKQFQAMNKLKKLALKVIAESLSEDEIKGLKEMFKNMDTDNNGTITFEELKRGLHLQGADLAESEVRQLMEAADVDRSGTIDYMEFITATIHLNKVDKEDHLYSAFQYFDKDSSGFITKEELEEALIKHNMENSKTIKEILAEADVDKDGRINYQEFVAMMRKGNPTLKPLRRRVEMPVGPPKKLN